MSITEFVQEAINSIPEQTIFFIVAGLCLLEPVVSPLAVASGLLLCYLKKPNFLDENEIYSIRRDEMLNSIDSELEEELESSTDSSDEVIVEQPTINHGIELIADLQR